MQWHLAVMYGVSTPVDQVVIQKYRCTHARPVGWTRYHAKEFVFNCEPNGTGTSICQLVNDVHTRGRFYCSIHPCSSLLSVPTVFQYGHVLLLAASKRNTHHVCLAALFVVLYDASTRVPVLPDRWVSWSRAMCFLRSVLTNKTADDLQKRQGQSQL